MDSPREVRSLAELLERGRRLIESAAKVRDGDDFRVWRANRNTWIWSAAEALEARHEGSRAQALRGLATVHDPTSAWHAVLPAELMRVREALVVLRELAGDA